MFYKVVGVRVCEDVTCYAILDPCANAVIMSEELAKELSLNTVTKKDQFHTVAGSSNMKYQESLDRITISSLAKTSPRFDIGRVQVMPCQKLLRLQCSHGS